MSKKEDGGEAMDILLSMMAEKMWGNTLQVSNFMKREAILVEEMLPKMAQAIIDGALLNGYEPILGSQKVLIGEEDSNQTQSIAGKLRAAMTARPAQFIAYCGFMTDEARKSRYESERIATKACHRLQRLLDMMGAAESIERLRTLWNEAMNEDEDEYK